MSVVIPEREPMKLPEFPGLQRLDRAGSVRLTSLLDRMDPEVAKKALEKYPDFSGAVSNMAKDQRQSVNQAMEQNAESQKAYYAACNSVLDSMKALLADEKLSFEQKREVLGQMRETAGLMGRKDAENKKFLRAVLRLGALAAFGSAVVLFAALGGRARTER